MADLLHDDTAAGETGFLRIMALQREALGGILYPVSCDGRVMRDLLDNEVGLAAVVEIWPVSVEKPARWSAGVAGMRI